MTKIEKSCKHCGSNFIIEYDSKGSGSGNAQRRAYCSKACKKDWIKKPENGRKQKVSCVICNSDFYLPPSQAVHRVTCSKRCYGLHIASINRKHSETVRKCAQCGLDFVCLENSRQKFCNPACFNVSQSQKITRVCEICSRTMTMKPSCTARFCSLVCRRKGQSLGLVKSHTNGRSGRRSDIKDSPYFKSSLEADFARYCIVLGIQFEYEKHVFEVHLEDGKKRFYTPDFYIPSEKQYIELKGIKLSTSSFSQKINSNSVAREALLKEGVNIKVVYMSDFYAMLKNMDLYDKIQNLEHRHYGKTAHLVLRHEDRQARSP